MFQNILENSVQILREHLFHVPNLDQVLSLLSQLKPILLVLLTWKIKRKLFTLFSYVQFHLMVLKAIILSPWRVLISREALLVLQCFLTRCVYRTIFSMRFAFLFQQICLDHVPLTCCWEYHDKKFYSNQSAVPVVM